MTTSRQYKALCSEAAEGHTEGDGVLLLHQMKPTPTVVISFAGVDQTFSTQVTRRTWDLLRIAAYTLLVDRRLRRGSGRGVVGDQSWKRTVEIVVPVRDVAFWSELQHDLAALVTSLSGHEDVRYRFVERSRPRESQEPLLNLESGEALPLDRVGDVLLFSGGLDSLTGVIDRLSMAVSDVTLTSHRAAAKTMSFQQALVSAIRAKHPDPRVGHVAIRAHLTAGAATDERSSRSRSFLFLALAAAVAEIGKKDRVYAYENGVVGANLPISENVCGSRATRTTHPAVVGPMARLLGKVLGRPLRIELPYLNLTRAEVVNRLVEAGGGGLIDPSFSCGSTVESESTRRHCGACTQCIDRRLALIAAEVEGLDRPNDYRVDIFGVQGRKPPNVDIEEKQIRVLVEYIRTALSYEKWTSIRDLSAEAWEVVDGVVSMSGGSRDDVAVEILRLHQRHAMMVSRALDRAMPGTISARTTGQYARGSFLDVLLSPREDEDSAGGSTDERVNAEPLLPSPGIYLSISHEEVDTIDEVRRAELLERATAWDLIIDGTRLGDLDVCPCWKRQGEDLVEDRLTATEWALLRVLVQKRPKALEPREIVRAAGLDLQDPESRIEAARRKVDTKVGRFAWTLMRRGKDPTTFAWDPKPHATFLVLLHLDG